MVIFHSYVKLPEGMFKIMGLNLSEMWMDLMNWALKPKKCGNTASNKEELGVFRHGRALHDSGVHPWAKPAPKS